MLRCARRINDEEARQSGLISLLFQFDGRAGAGAKLSVSHHQSRAAGGRNDQKTVQTRDEMPLRTGVVYEWGLSALIANREDRAAGRAAFQKVDAAV
ncbi:hypothetical protein E0L21_03310 [Kosakonia quasisacchari]|uniref:Uncharacterized protein n=2 Tax=Enterobacteriaceae TaxID=543 RepID=A0A4R0HTP5_9ENTR|nr:hypothetical protein E0L21_03310 [Kosakonia quasisacchari]